MKAAAIAEHFHGTAPWLDRNQTVDRVIVGDPNRDVRSCLVTWISNSEACRAAIERGVDLLITHEPTFYGHWDKPQPGEPPQIAKKREWLEKSNLVILRLHDTWDCYPGEGVPWAWARFLGLTGQPVKTGDMEPPSQSVVKGMTRPPTMLRFDVAPTTAGEFVRKVAARTAELGEPAIQFVGDDSTRISRIGIGTGCICSPRIFMTMGCDCSVVCDDGTAYWSWIQLAQDEGHPVIRVNHGTAEEPGMRTLTEYINRTLPGLKAEYLPHKPAFRVVQDGAMR